MNDLQIFKNPDFGEVRTVTIDNEPWFVGKDVAEILGYSNPSKAIMVHVDAEDKTFEMLGVADSQNGNVVKTALINESGLYSLILSSKMPTAKNFKRWVTAEVIPSIRKHGAYMTPETIEAALLNPDMLIRIATELKSEQEKRKALEEQAKLDKQKVVFANAVSVSNTSILIGELAKLLKQNGIQMGQNRLFDWMRKNGYLIKRKGTDYNLPTQRAMEKGLFEIKETTVCHSDGHTSISKTPKVTGSGQVFFINQFLGK